MDKYIGSGIITLPDNFNLPPMSILISKSDELPGNPIEVTNIDFGFVNYGATIENAFVALRNILIDYVQKTIDTFGYDRLIEVATSPGMEQLWVIYRRLSFSLVNECKVTNPLTRAVYCSKSEARDAV